MLGTMDIATLYICYFGINEPLVHTQVLPYLRQLSAAGVRVNLLTFEPGLRKTWSAAEVRSTRESLAADGISWFCLAYHKSPSLPATLYDIVAGARFALRMARREGIRVLHARSHVPMAMALLADRFMRFKLIFDIRGLMAEEYADAALWTEGSLPFRMVKRLERAGIRRADQIVVLTARLRDWLVGRRLKSAEEIEVIPCCVDIGRFEEDQSANLGETSPSDRFDVVYAGSLVGLYLVEEMGRFFQAIKRKRPEAYLRILSVSPREQGVAALKRAGLKESDFNIRAVIPSDVPMHLRRARLGVSFRKPAFAQIAASPTKIPEYLAAGLPIVCSAGIGDLDELVEREQVGVVLRQFDEDACQRAADEALVIAQDPKIRERCRRVARLSFDLQTVGGQRYLNVYRRLAER
ncbi:MAG TPA: glycosyltransferase [Pyrinomonadaceae bacterium]